MSEALPAAGALLQVHRLRQLRKTVRVLRERSDFYRDRLNGVLGDFGLEDFRKLPRLTKQEHQEHLPELWLRDQMPDFLSFSGGTSGAGISGLAPSSHAFLERGLALQEAAQADDPVDSRELTLRQSSSSQGAVPRPNSRTRAIEIPFTRLSNYVWALRFLKGEVRVPGVPADARIVRLSLPTPVLRQLVHFMWEQGCTAGELALREVFSYSGYLSTEWRRKMETAFGVERIIDCFGFTEALGTNAIQCPDCGFYHYGPDAFWEIQSVSSPEQCDAKEGRLLFTSLTSETDAVGLVRYESGDLVRRTPFCDFAGDYGFVPMGREAWTPRAPAGAGADFLFFTVSIQERIDTRSDVARIANLRHSGVTATVDDAFPKWRVVRREDTDGVVSVEVEIEMKYNPPFFPDVWSEFRDGLLRHLLALNPVLEEQLAAGRVRLEIRGLPPGTLQDRDVFIV